MCPLGLSVALSGEMELQFLGGAQTVTGSKSLLTIGGRKLLIDCGLFQGLKELRLKNWKSFPFNPKELEAVLLTHAHLDHSGALPLLTRQGFRGPIYASQPTRDLSEVILKDSARLQEEDADFANRHKFSKHSPAKPLYNLEDAVFAISRFQSIPKDRWRTTPSNIRFRLTPSSHILGSTFVEIVANETHIVFSGDLGRSNPLLYYPPAHISSADVLILESTYGDRNHPSGQASDALQKIIHETHRRRGQLLIPSFAVGRAQELLFLLWKLQVEKKIPKLPIYLDSPMGEAATRIFHENDQWHRLLPEEVKEMCSIATIVHEQKHSIEIMNSEEPSIVIAGSGMLSGGRILHHLEHRLPDSRNIVLLVGYQAPGTRGRLLKDGVSELKIHGKYIPVRADVREISDLSAHADQSEIIRWLKGFKTPPKKIFINHGEPQASDALRVKIRDSLGWESIVAKENEKYSLEMTSCQS
jgi:metallo-beta-lactamase family protein